jgi:hypothetical protein
VRRSSAIAATSKLALASARRQSRILKLSSAFVGAGELREILLEPEAVQYVGYCSERDARFAAFDGAQSGARHACPLGQEQRREAAPTPRQPNVFAEFRE